MNETIWLNDQWGFTENYSEAFAAGEACDTVEVRLPHTVKETPFHYFDDRIYQMVCGYRRLLFAPESWRGRHVLLNIGAAGHSAEVYVNGRKAAEHGCGYTAFCVDLSGFLEYGEKNLLVIRVDSREQQNIPPFGFVIDYMTYGGLYREVSLEIKEENYLEDVFVRPEIPRKELLLDDSMTQSEVKEALADIRFAGTVRSEILLGGAEPAGEGKRAAEGLFIRQRIFCYGGGHADGECLAEKILPIEKCQPIIREGLGRTDRGWSISLVLEKAALWDNESPGLYLLKTELLEEGESGQALDTKETVFGFRRAEFRKEGFWLNGRKVKLLGLNRHQSYPYVGYAMPRSMQRLDADILKKELGLNAVRTSHYPQSPYFCDRCDELGLLMFTEIPGWQHIGDAAWKEQAVRNVEEMVRQYRNHPSIILWGVRINESQDDEALYTRTNELARKLDPTRPTGGVRYLKKSQFLEDVYTYNDFIHDGEAKGCERKKDVTPDVNRPYLISEYNGHMYPTKTFDSEGHRLEHALRHANVLDAVAGQTDIAGSFGWCMADYNTHKDFGSGDRICYHGVLDMFRNPKLAAAVYAAQQEETPVLEISSNMDIGEHPTGNMGRIYIITNADSVRMYKNGRFVREYTHADSEYRKMKNGPILITDFIGDAIMEGEGFPKEQADAVAAILNAAAIYGNNHIPKRILAKAVPLILKFHMDPGEAYGLYGRYIGNWGGEATEFRFDAVKDGKVVRSVKKTAADAIHLEVCADHTHLAEESTYDVAALRLSMRDQNDSLLSFYQGAVMVSVSGPAEVIGPKCVILRGGVGGTYIRTTGETGDVIVTLTSDQAEPVVLHLTASGSGDR